MIIKVKTAIDLGCEMVLWIWAFAAKLNDLRLILRPTWGNIQLIN